MSQYLRGGGVHACVWVFISLPSQKYHNGSKWGMKLDYRTFVPTWYKLVIFLIGQRAWKCWIWTKLKGRKTGKNAQIFLGTLHLVLMSYGYNGNKLKVKHFDLKKTQHFEFWAGNIQCFHLEVSHFCLQYQSLISSFIGLIWKWKFVSPGL